MEFILTNHLEVLYNRFKERAFSNHPLTRRLVVVYGPAMKTWLMLQMAKDPDLRIATGIEIVCLHEAFETLLSIFQKNSKNHFPTLLELSFFIENALKKILSNEVDEVWKPLLSYMDVKTRKGEKRLVSLSQHIAKSFREQGRLHSCEWEMEWLQILWNQLFCSRNYLSKSFEEPIQNRENIEIHFFSISFITEAEFQFLTKISQNTPLFYYLLSPCALFWSDIRSNEDQNILLANFGRIGREMAKRIEESSFEVTAFYEVPSKDDFIHEDIRYLENSPHTLLHAIQTDLLLMRDHERIYIDDDSIQLHTAPTLRREIEILYHNLLAILDKNPELQPGDIIVMAPEISDYVPYIQSIFGSQDSILNYQIIDLALQAQSEIVRGFLQLIALSESRWSSSDILQLFEHPAFRRKHHITQNDFNLIQEWIEKTGILWGSSSTHRNELLQRSHCAQNMVEETSAGTWEQGFRRLLFGLAEGSETIEFSQCELLGKWIFLFQSLREDLAPLHDGTQKTIEEWTKYLQNLLEIHFQPDFNQPNSKEDFQNLKYQFQTLKRAAEQIKDSLFGFYSVKARLDSLLQQKGMSYRENHVQSVQFCSLIPLRSIPTQVLALIGMEDEAFPRLDKQSPFKTKSKEYLPNQTDQDRHLFLEMLHSVRSVLLISYQGCLYEENREMLPSLVVQELFSYINKHYAPERKAVKHPFDAFDRAYFQKDSILHNFSEKNYRQALTYYEKKVPAYTVDYFNEKPTAELTDIETIDIKHLTAMVKNPIKFYLNRGLEIYLEKEEDREVKKEESLSLSSLDKFILKKEALQKPLQEVLLDAEKKGKLPYGMFKNVAIQKLQTEVNELREQLKNHSISPQDFFRIEFNGGCSQPIQIERDHWLYPSPTLMFGEKKISITGTLSNVTEKGPISFGKNTLDEAWKMWPEFLLYHHAKRDGELIFASYPHSKKPFFNESIPYLKDLIEYYFICLKNPSPLMPEWISLILDGNMIKLEEKIQQSLKESNFGNNYKNLELQWFFDRAPTGKAIIDSWKGQAEKLLKEIVTHWFSDKGS